MKKTPVFLAQMVLMYLFIFFAWNCRREIQMTADRPLPQRQLVHRTNPFSLSNITRALESAAGGRKTVDATAAISLYPRYVYFRINPANFQANQSGSLINDTSALLMDYPFADGALINDSTLTESSIAQLRDGYVYGVVPWGDSLLAKLQVMTNLQFQSLDTLVLLPDSSGTVSLAMKQAGFDVSAFGICLAKKPSGHIRYYDNELGRNEPVAGIKVWALVGGIPVSSYTNADGYYEINFRFSFGTIMGTEARNKRVAIRPLDMNGTTAGAILRSIVQFTIGGVNPYGWVGSCSLSGKDITYSAHSRTRFWCHIMNAYYYHDKYCEAEGIYNAPDKMLVYAIWKGGTVTPSASTPMLGHMNLISLIVNTYLNGLWGSDLATEHPNMFNTIRGVVPDMTIGCPETDRTDLSKDITQTAFHELAHASFFRQVGNTWWETLIQTELVHGGNENYGDGTYENAGYVTLAESWAEYIGRNYAVRRYPASTYATLIETGGIYAGRNFLPCGLFHDMNDATNVNEVWDQVSGVHIQQMYFTFAANITSLCQYEKNFTQNNTVPNLWPLYDHYGNTCGRDPFVSAAFSGRYFKNDCGPGSIGSGTTITSLAGAFTSSISQADADAKATAYAQAEANRRGTCPCTSCSTEGYKCLNTRCTLGIRINTGTKQEGNHWTCTYHYEWTDGTRSVDYLQSNTAPCRTTSEP